MRNEKSYGSPSSQEALRFRAQGQLGWYAGFAIFAGLGWLGWKFQPSSPTQTILTTQASVQEEGLTPPQPPRAFATQEVMPEHSRPQKRRRSGTHPTLATDPPVATLPPIRVDLLDPDGLPFSRRSLLVRLEETRDGGQRWHRVRGQFSKRITTDGKGRFTLERHGSDHRYRVKWVSNPFGERRGVYLKSSEYFPADSESVTLQTQQGADLTGRVLGLRGLPCSLVVDYGKGKIRRTPLISASGRFKLEGLPEGLTTIRIIANIGSTIHTIPQVRITSERPQDARLSQILVTHNFRPIEVRAIPPFNESLLSVKYRATSTTSRYTLGKSVEPGLARFFTDDPAVDLIVSAPGSCEHYQQGVTQDLEVSLDPAIWVKLRVVDTDPADLRRLREVEFTWEGAAIEETKSVRSLRPFGDDPNLWVGHLTHPGPWTIKCRVLAFVDPEVRSETTRTSSWTTLPGLPERIHAVPNQPINLQISIPR